MEKLHEHALKDFAILIDLRKAYDSVSPVIMQHCARQPRCGS